MVTLYVLVQLTTADLAHGALAGPVVVQRVLARELHQRLPVAALPEAAHPRVEAALPPVELVLLRAVLWGPYLDDFHRVFGIFDTLSPLSWPDLYSRNCL